MYNMDITLFGFKFNLEILILIGVVYLVLVAHTIGGSCNMPLIMEGLSSMTDPNKKNGKMMPKKEGFTGANTNYGESSQYSLGDYSSPDTSSWGAPTMTVTPGQPVPKAVKQFLARKEQPVPLPEGELSMFANTPFKPECCPNTFSNSSGCACMTGKQYNYLIERGGNNIPYSEY
jgi:hypothetical protein